MWSAGPLPAGLCRMDGSPGPGAVVWPGPGPLRGRVPGPCEVVWLGVGGPWPARFEPIARPAPMTAAPARAAITTIAVRRWVHVVRLAQLTRPDAAGQRGAVRLALPAVRRSASSRCGSLTTGWEPNVSSSGGSALAAGSKTGIAAPGAGAARNASIRASALAGRDGDSRLAVPLSWAMIAVVVGRLRGSRSRHAATRPASPQGSPVRSGGSVASRSSTSMTV